METEKKSSLFLNFLSQSADEGKESEEREEWLHKDEKQPPVSADFVALCIFTQGITWFQTKEKAPRDVFLPAWDFDTCLAAANWNGSVSNEISARCMGREKKVTHYNNSTWFTELSHLCLPTFPLISFGDPGKVYVHVWMCASFCTCLPDTYSSSISLSVFSLICSKIKIPC